jgi:hypothetical protein
VSVFGFLLLSLQGRRDAVFEICRRTVIEGSVLQRGTQSNLAAIDKTALFALFKVLFNC